MRLGGQGGLWPKSLDACAANRLAPVPTSNARRPIDVPPCPVNHDHKTGMHRQKAGDADCGLCSGAAARAPTACLKARAGFLRWAGQLRKRSVSPHEVVRSARAKSAYAAFVLEFLCLLIKVRAALHPKWIRLMFFLEMPLVPF